MTLTGKLPVKVDMDSVPEKQLLALLPPKMNVDDRSVILQDREENLRHPVQTILEKDKSPPPLPPRDNLQPRIK